MKDNYNIKGIKDNRRQALIKRAILDNDQDYLNELLLTITDEATLESIFGYAMLKNAVEIADQILPKITDQEILGRALEAAIHNNKQEMFNQLLPKVTDQAWLGRALEAAIYNNKQEMFAQLLPKITDQKALGKALKETLHYKAGSEMFDQLLPKVTDQERLDEAFLIAIDYDGQEMLAKLLPKVTNQEILGRALEEAISNNNQEMFDQLLQKVTDQERLDEAFRETIYTNKQEMFAKLLPKITNQEILGKALKETRYNNNRKIIEKAFDSAISNNNQEMLDQLLPRINNKSYLAVAVDQARKDSRESMVNLIEKRIYAIDHPWLAYAADSLESASNWVKLGGAKVGNIGGAAQPPLVAPAINETLLGNSAGALPSSNPTDKPAPAQAAGSSWQNIGAQVALAAVAGALVYGAGKYAYDLYKRNTGPDAKPEDIEQATILLKKVAKFDPKELSKISQEFKAQAEQMTSQLNQLYDAKKSNSEEYKNLREQLDKVTANQNAISTLQNSMKAMKSEAKHFVAPQYALKEGYVGGIIKECTNIQDICEKLGVSMANSPKSHAQKIMAERKERSSIDKAL